MLVQMSKVHIMGLKADFLDVLDALQTFGKIHLCDLAESIEAGKLPVQSMQLFERSEQQREAMLLMQQRGQVMVKGLFGDEKVLVNACPSDNLTALPLAELIDRCGTIFDKLEPQTFALVTRFEELSSELSELVRYEPIMRKVAPTVESLVAGRDVDSIALLFEKRYKGVIEELEAELTRVTESHSTLVVQNLDEDMLAAVVIVDRPWAAAARALLSDENVSRIKLPSRYEALPFAEALVQVQERIVELPDMVQQASANMGVFAESNRNDLCETLNELTSRIQQLDAVAQFGETEYTFIIAGYVPTKSLETLRALIAKSWDDTVVVDDITIDPHQYNEVPVQFDNKARFKWFQSVLGIWGTPMYGTIDPSMLLALSFPFIFGMIVGDAGYGLLLLGLCLFFKKKYPENQMVQAFTNVLAPAGLMAILFGIFYFEFFGDLAHVYIPGINQIHPIQIGTWFSLPFIRTAKAFQNTLLLMAIGFGFFEISLGLVLGMINGRRTGHSKHVLEKAGILLILFSGVALLLLTVVPAITAPLGSVGSAIATYAIYAVLALGFGSVFWGGGLMGVIETMESVSHVASYIRIMAVGLVGALLADAANRLAFETMPNAAGIFIALILHILNFAIICFSPSIHALRLNFLEFFGKFWEPGSELYHPFVRAGKEG